jgi:hypothetical protein
MKKQGFSLEQTTAPEDWHFFHTRMVHPQALVRHGESAWLPSSDFLRALARAGTLHLVSRAGERVAGLCTVPHGDKLWLPLSGVLDGKQELLRQGAGFAGLALAFEWGKANGFLQVDVGRTAPSCTMESNSSSENGDFVRYQIPWRTCWRSGQTPTPPVPLSPTGRCWSRTDRR